MLIPERLMRNYFFRKYIAVSLIPAVVIGKNKNLIKMLFQKLKFSTNKVFSLPIWKR